MTTPITTDKQYWAKGTGFGTGSTTSTWDINNTINQHHSDELMTGMCLAILGEWINKEKQESEGQLEEKEKNCITDVYTNGTITLASDDILDMATDSLIEEERVECIAAHTGSNTALKDDTKITDSITSDSTCTTIDLLRSSCLLLTLGHYISNDSSK